MLLCALLALRSRPVSDRRKRVQIQQHAHMIKRSNNKFRRGSPRKVDVSDGSVRSARLGSGEQITPTLDAAEIHQQKVHIFDALPGWGRESRSRPRSKRLRSNKTFIFSTLCPAGVWYSGIVWISYSVQWRGAGPGANK